MTREEMMNMNIADFEKHFQQIEDKRNAVLSFLAGDVDETDPSDISFILASALGKVLQSIAISQVLKNARWEDESERLTLASGVFNIFYDSIKGVIETYYKDTKKAVKDENIGNIEKLIKEKG